MPVALTGLLHEQEWIVENAIVGYLQMNAVISHRHVRDSTQCRKEVLLSFGIVDRPPVVEESSDTAEPASVNKAGHVELPFRRVAGHVPASISCLTPAGTHQETNTQCHCNKLKFRGCR